MINLKEQNLSNYCIDDNGQIFSIRVKRFLTGWLDTNGYQITGVTDDSGEHIQVGNHRICCTAFYQKPSDKHIVNHIDGDKSNPHKANVEWVTPSENNKHAYDTNLSRGKASHKSGIPTLKGYYLEQSKLTEELVHEICQLIVQGYRDVDISRMLGVGRKNISLLRHKQEDYWVWITNSYTFSFKKEERMSPEIVKKICTLLEQEKRVMEIVEEVGINRKKVGNIKSRKTFTEISSRYKW